MNSQERQVPGQRFAAIVDLENLAIVNHRLLSPAQVGDVLSFVDAQVAGMQVRVASGVNVLRAHFGAVASRGWGRTLVKTTPDAADHALLETAQHFVACGVTDLVVVSGDHAFVPLARQVRLHVVTHADHLGTRLRLAATTVMYVPHTRNADRIAA